MFGFAIVSHQFVGDCAARWGNGGLGVLYLGLGWFGFGARYRWLRFLFIQCLPTYSLVLIAKGVQKQRTYR